MTRPAPHDPGLAPLLARVSRAYRRRDDDAFRALLGEALDRAPQRLDLGLSLANHYIQTGEVATAVGLFARLLEQSPGDRDCLSYLAHWHRHLGDKTETARFVRRLGKTHPSRLGDMRLLWDIIDAAEAMRVDGTLPAPVGKKGMAVVVLGYVLNPDGSMHDILRRRLEKALEAAAIHPRAIVIVSGGVPKRGKTEAVVMRRWLTANGVARERIVEEGYARDVVENLLFSRQILDLLRLRRVVAVTSAIDVRRTAAGLDILRRMMGSAWSVSGVAASDTPPSRPDGGAERVKLYRDSLRLYGMPMMGVFPKLAER